MPTIKPQTKSTNKETEVVIPEHTIAKVVQRREHGKVVSETVNFDAQVIQNENTNSETDDERETGTFEIGGKDDYIPLEDHGPPIPKSKLEVMFGNIRRAITEQHLDDNFLAAITRTPDVVGMKFNSPCSMIMDLGAFQFTSRDQFAFQSAIQERNRNSGGIFNVRVYEIGGKPLTIIRNKYDYELRGQLDTEIGLLNYTVPDPPTSATANANGASNPNGFENLMLQHMQKSDERFLLLLEQMNKPKEQSDIEKRIMDAAITRMLNPPEVAQKRSLEDIMAEVVGSTAVLASMGDAMAKMINRPSPEQPEVSMLDNIGKALQLEPVANALDALTNISEKWMIAKIKDQSQIPVTDSAEPANDFVEQEPTPEQIDQQNKFNEMQQLIKSLVGELESDTKLDESNPFIQTLQTVYPTQAKTLIATCKAVDFETITKMLVAQMRTFNPNPIMPFINEAETTKQNTIVWNERGKKMLVRLNEFYDFVKTL